MSPEIPSSYSIEPSPSREPCAASPALLRDEAGHVLAVVERVPEYGDAPAWHGLADRVRRALRAF